MTIPSHRLDQMTGIEASVYEHVPIGDWFSAQQVHAMLAQAGTTVSIQQTVRCLETLTNSGILRRRGDSHRGEFQRAKVKARRTLTVVDKATDEGPREAPQEPADDAPSLEGLSCLLGDMTAAQADVEEAVRRVRASLDAVERYIDRLDRQMRAEAEDLEELRALSALLDRRAARTRGGQ